MVSGFRCGAFVVEVWGVRISGFRLGLGLRV